MANFVFGFLFLSLIISAGAVSLFRHRKEHPYHNDDDETHQLCYYRHRYDYVCDEFFSYRRDSCYGKFSRCLKYLQYKSY